MEKKTRKTLSFSVNCIDGPFRFQYYDIMFRRYIHTRGEAHQIMRRRVKRLYLYIVPIRISNRSLINAEG